MSSNIQMSDYSEPNLYFCYEKLTLQSVYNIIDAEMIRRAKNMGTNRPKGLILVFCCSGPGRRPSAAVYQSHHGVGLGHAQEGPAGLARQSSKVRLHRKHQQR